MMLAIAWMLLSLAVTTHGINTIPIVEKVELNETGGIRQIILWTHENTGGEYKERVAQWWLVANEPLPEHRDGWLVFRSRGVVFRTKRFYPTKTKLDPEVLDRDELRQEQRTPYFDIPDLFTD